MFVYYQLIKGKTNFMQLDIYTILTNEKIKIVLGVARKRSLQGARQEQEHLEMMKM